MTRTLTVARETFPIAGVFTIARGSRTEAHVVTATIDDGGHRGHGECVPYARYGETVESVMAAIETVAPAIAAGAGRAEIARLMPPGVGRNRARAEGWG